MDPGQGFGLRWTQGDLRETNMILFSWDGPEYHDLHENAAESTKVLRPAEHCTMCQFFVTFPNKTTLVIRSFSLPKATKTDLVFCSVLT